MDLELGLKITQARDHHANIHIKMDNTPFFSFKETKSMFFLIGNLPGFRKEKINIEIDNGGTLIVISGDKWVQEMMMVKWALYKGLNTKVFTRTFRIPEGVDLNHIRARFDEEDGILIVSMPKLFPGRIRRIGIEEIKTDEVDNDDRESGLGVEVSQEKVGDTPVAEEKPESRDTGEKRELQMPEAPVIGEEQDVRFSETEMPETHAVEIQEKTVVENDIEKTTVALAENNQEPEYPHLKLPAIIDGVQVETKDQDQEITLQKPEPEISALQEVSKDPEMETQRKMEEKSTETQMPKASSPKQKQDGETTEMEKRPELELLDMEEERKPDSDLPKLEVTERPLSPSSELIPDKESLKVESQEVTPIQEIPELEQEQRRDEQVTEMETNMPRRNLNGRDQSKETTSGISVDAASVIAGSAFIASLSVLVMHLWKLKRK